MAALPLKALFDRRKMALAQAKFRAWWEGEAFDEAAAIAAFEASANDHKPIEGADDHLFDEPPYELPPRLSALAALWGEGRVRPGQSAAEAGAVARLAIPADGVLAVLSPGLAAPVVAVAEKHPGKIQVFEWRDETLDALKHGVKAAKLDDRVSVARIDLEAHVFAASSLGGLLSIDDFAYSGHPPHLAQQLMKSLKPGAGALIECYVGLPVGELQTAFASAFAEPQIRAHGDLVHVFKETGLAIETDEDMSEEFLECAREGFKGLGERLAGAAFNVAAAQELAWEAQAWRVRMKLLSQKRLERRRFLVRRPAEAAATSLASPPG